MKRIVLILVVSLLSGCGVYECIDAKFVRDVKPIEQAFNVELQFGEKTMNMSIQCEEYYSAMCAERGNYWAIREVGYESQYQTSIFKFFDKKLGEIEIPIPKCSDMARDRKTPLKHIVLKVKGENYWLQSSVDNVHTYKSSKLLTGQRKTITVNMSLKINHEPIK